MKNAKKQELICSVLKNLKKTNIDEVALISATDVLLNKLYKQRSANRDAAAAAAREIVFEEWI
jgi:hypothetical protein